MIKSELVQELSKDNPHLYRRDVENIVNAIISEIAGAMISGNRVELRGFGVFYVKERNARKGRNPRTGTSVDIEGKYIPFFKTAKEMHRRLNKGTF